MSERDAIGLAMLFAYVRGQSEAVDFLMEKDGNWNMTGVNNGTTLHHAAGSGDLATVQRIVAKGADMSDLTPKALHSANPLWWPGSHDVLAWMPTKKKKPNRSPSRRLMQAFVER
jgi:hypothetical protein